MRRTLGAACLWVVFLCGGSAAQGQAVARALWPSPAMSARGEEGAQQFADFGDFKLQSGAVIHDFRLGYRTLGELNAGKSNAILWPTWLGGKSQGLLQFARPGNVADSTKYFVVLVDSIGDGVSSSPSNSKTQARLKFPEFTIRDMVDAERRLAVERLGLRHLHAVVGVSMGGMQAFEWAVAYPDFMDVAIPIMGSPQSTAYDKLLWTAQIDALELDPEWRDGNGTKPMAGGFGVFSEIGSMANSSPAFRVAQTTPGEFAAFLAETRRSETSDAGGACDVIRQRQAIMALDVAGEFGVTLEQAARRVRAKLLVIISPEDHTVNPGPALAFAGAIGAPVVTLDSACGHNSPSCISVGPIAAKFLEAPGSVESMILH
ncbi:MAG: alpha/beta fold hydrolase [Candidatus Acidiferrales bacterium]